MSIGHSNIPELNQTAETENVQRAICDSIRENRIVVLKSRIDTENWLNLTNELSTLAQDWTARNDGVREYWGVDENNQEWRIHVVARGEF